MNFDRRLVPARPDLAAESLRGQVEAPRYAVGRPLRVITPSAPLRARPSPEAGYDTEALLGERVTLYDEDEEGWAWVQLAADSYVGYIPRWALGPLGPEPTHRVGVLRTFVYPGPNLKLPIEGHLSLCAEVTVEAAEGAYARIAGGGWVFAEHLRPHDRFEADFVAVAELFVQTPYLWGGKTSLGIDCSGLVQLSMRAAGLSAPRDTDMQEKSLGEPLPLSEGLVGLRRGDLVFWKGHVGIMRDEHELLHANGHHMMTYSEPLSGARARILEKSFGPITSIRRL